MDNTSTADLSVSSQMLAVLHIENQVRLEIAPSKLTSWGLFVGS